MGKIIITEKNNRLLLTLFDEKKPYLMEMASLPETESMLGNIYLAKVRDVVPGINSAFLSISNDKMAFLSLERCKDILCANRQLSKGDFLRQGDEIVVQIAGEALKTKRPAASERLTLVGQYCVCEYFGHGISFSQKLEKEKKRQIFEEIKQSLSLRNDALPEGEQMAPGDALNRKKVIEGRRRYHFTIRTNTENLETFAPLLDEMNSFVSVFDNLTAVYKHRTVYSCLYRREAEILDLIKNIPLNAYDEIVTDGAEVYKLLADGCKGIQDKKIRLYQDSMLSLSNLYSIETHLQEALGKKVWLRCGGYLIIEPTEAMVVIDVNTGKASSKAKGKAGGRASEGKTDGASENKKGNRSYNYYLKVNLEAAQEVARQLRIRNYSGMIMVDFINMDSDEDNRTLLHALDAYLREDKVKTRLVDMTALGIVEITRKKTRKPLADFF